MLERIADVPSEVWGVRASGVVSKEDYERVVLPHLEEARRQGRRVRILYHLGPDFDRFTPGAAWRTFASGCGTCGCSSGAPSSRILTGFAWQHAGWRR